MNKLALSVVTLALLSGTALAADLQVYAPVEMAPAASADGNFYASIFGGIAMIDHLDYDSSTGESGVLNVDNGYSVDGAFGYDFGNGLSLEAQLGYLSADLSSATYSTFEFGASGSASAVYGMVNAWYGFDMGGVTPFVGGGVGVASLTLDSQYESPFDGSSFDDTQTTYAAQVGFGVSLNLAENIDLVGRYRYFMTGDVTMVDGADDEVTASLDAHLVDIGLKIAF